MDYITLRQAAQGWGISERLAQKYCADGRVAGARKFGGRWAVPAAAPKPEDPRRAPSRPAAAAPLLPMPLLNGAFPPGGCLEYLARIEDDRLRQIALSEYGYFTGRPEQAAREAEPYLTSPEPALRLSACLLFAYANLSLGQPQRVRAVLDQARAAAAGLDPQASPVLRAEAAFVTAAASVLLHLPAAEAVQAMQRELRWLPPGLQLFALYVQAHHAYLQGDYGRSLGVVETALALQDPVCPIPAIYLHLAAVMDHMSLKQPEPAQAHLLAAWELARPDDLIQPFGEHHGLLGGMLEAALKKDWPEDFRRIIAITYRFSAGWRRIHNPDTGDEVADNLTTTEFATAMLAARGWSNQEIANHMGLSANTVRRHISAALQKLGVRQRKDLKDHMLR